VKVGVAVLEAQVTAIFQGLLVSAIKLVPLIWAAGEVMVPTKFWMTPVQV
jgi:hypothetical protein